MANKVDKVKKMLKVYTSRINYFVIITSQSKQKNLNKCDNIY